MAPRLSPEVVVVTEELLVAVVPALVGGGCSAYTWLQEISRRKIVIAMSVARPTRFATSHQPGCNIEASILWLLYVL